MGNVALKLAENVRNIGVKSVYGDPVELDGVTIIPVALGGFGFGGGSDAGENDDVAGGGGGGGWAVPVGAYVRDENGVHFEPNVISLLAVGIPFLWVWGKTMARIIRALKK